MADEKKVKDEELAEITGAGGPELADLRKPKGGGSGGGGPDEETDDEPQLDDFQPTQ
jgi:hypothetical protein